jgi:tRNA G18 (ribose-2'-O)-methylase SpoU
MGTAFTLPIVESDDLRRDLLRLRDELRFELTATVLDASAQPLEAALATPRMGILFGNEKHGLDSRWFELCSRKLTITMAAGADSLNVAVAAGIFFYHLRRAGEGLGALQQSASKPAGDGTRATS